MASDAYEGVQVNPGSITSFLTNYVGTLKERTREETKGVTSGIDTLIYSLGVSLGWKPLRLPFLRQSGKTAKSKPEAEFGVDLSFLRKNETELVIFVLKDEPLTYKQFAKANFDTDLRRAAAYNVNRPEIKKVKSVHIILAYNKDDDARGIESYEGLVSGYPRKIGKAKLVFERWNLSEITSRVERHLLVPSLLPQRFFGRLTYLCSQVADFRHGSEEWATQLVPNWRGFLTELLERRSDDGLRRVAVALYIVREHGRENPSFETGWIDLCEWAVLALWKAYAEKPTKRAFSIVWEVWTYLYIAELDRFYLAHQKELATESSIDSVAGGSFLAPYAANHISFWHLSRVGLLSMAFSGFLPSDTDEQKELRWKKVNQITDTVVDILNAQTSARCPCLEIQHIEIFLVWRALCVVMRLEDIEAWLEEMINRLYLRRSEKSIMMPISSHPWPIFIEQVGRKLSPTVEGQSSFLLQMLMEFACSVPEKARGALCDSIMRHVVNGQRNGNGNQDIHLVCWLPEPGWNERILRGYAPEGIEVSPSFDCENTALPLPAQVAGFVEQTRDRYPFDFVGKVPPVVYSLACLKYESPLPPEMWRAAIFPAAVKAL